MRKLQRLKAKHKNQNHNGKSDAPNPQIPSVLVLKSQATDATRGDRRHYWLHGARVARSLLALIRWLACHVRRRSLSLTHAVLNETNTDQACWRSPIACIARMTMLVTVESDVCTVNVRHFHDRNAIPVHCTPKRPPFSFFLNKRMYVWLSVWLSSSRFIERPPSFRRCTASLIHLVPLSDSVSRIVDSEPHVRPISCHVTSLPWQEPEEELRNFFWRRSLIEIETSR